VAFFALEVKKSKKTLRCREMDATYFLLCGIVGGVERHLMEPEGTEGFFV
jgi:hypothetical protein